MNVDFMFLDYSTKCRGASEICKNIKILNPKATVAFGYIKSESQENLAGFDYIFCMREYNMNPQKIFEAYTPKVILLYAFRFFDYMMCIEAHKRNIIVLNLQHGLYQPSTVISKINIHTAIPLITNKYEKIGLYFKCIYYIADKNYSLWFRILDKIIRGESHHQVIHWAYPRQSDPDICFIYGELWKKYYQELFGINNTNYEIVGYPDLEKPLEQVKPGSFERENFPVICYLAQSSAEDGIVTRNEMEIFSKKLETLLVNYNLIIKFHPRSDKSIYANLLQERYKGKVYIWNDTSFPIADGYIGHQSSVVACAMNLTDKVLIVRIRKNQDPFFEPYTNYVCNNDDDLKKCVIKMMNCISKGKSKIGKLVYRNENGAYLQIAKKMVELL